MKKCVILEIEDKVDFENQLNKYISSGYKIESSSCKLKGYTEIYNISELIKSLNYMKKK